MAGAMHTQLAKQLEEAKLIGDHFRRYAITMAQTVAIDNTGPLLVRSLLEAVLLIAAYIVFLHYSALRWHRLSGVPDPFSQVSIFVPITFTSGYIAFVHYGSRYMRLRKSPVVSRVFECMLVYNLYQAVLNLCCAIAFICEIRRQGMTIWGNQYIYAEDQYHLGFLIWLHYTNTYIELLDTVFILLRKKFRRISFLHVYQRILMVWSWFIVCKLAAGGDSYFPAVLHSLVHIVTYSYYLLAILKLPTPRKEKVTHLHIMECSLCAIHSIYVLWKGNMPPFLALTQLFVMLNMLVLFTDFHFRQLAKKAVDPRAEPRIVFSFDSSGWLFLYHFGVARYLKEQYLKDDNAPSVAYSGASGGALVATALCSKVDLDRLIAYVVACRKNCYYAPWRMMHAVDDAIAQFLPDDSYITCSNKIRVLTTKLLPHPPFVMGEVSTEFQNRQHLAQVLRASCHVPLVGGVLPYHITEAGGGWYYDGLFWSSGLGFVPWRSETREDKVVRISGLGIWGAQIKPQFTFPPWWSIVPPTEETLWGMVEQGYYDAARVLGPKKAIDDPKALPEQVLKFQEAVYRAWMVAVLIILGCLSVILAFSI